MSDGIWPKRGDVIGCSDGDIGIVVSLSFDDPCDDPQVEIAWNSGRILTDPWYSVDISDDCGLFWIMSRA